MSKTKQKQQENPFEVTIDEGGVPKDFRRVTISLPIHKNRLELLREIAQIHPFADNSVERMIHMLASKGLNDQINNELESTHRLGRNFSDYLKRKYLPKSN